jgi:hypothetical protein
MQCVLFDSIFEKLKGRELLHFIMANNVLSGFELACEEKKLRVFILFSSFLIYRLEKNTVVTYSPPKLDYTGW